jgi:hypothetical protein
MVQGAVVGILMLGAPVADAAAAADEAVPVDASVGAPAAGADTEPPAPGPTDPGETGAAPPPAEPAQPPVEPEPLTATPPPAAVAPAPAGNQPLGPAGEPAEPRPEDAAGGDRRADREPDPVAADAAEPRREDAAVNGPEGGHDEASAAPAAQPVPAVDAPPSTAGAPQPGPGRLTGVAADAVPAGDRTAVPAGRLARMSDLLAPRRRDSAEPSAPIAPRAPLRGRAESIPVLLGQPVIAATPASDAHLPRSARVRSSPTHGPHDPPKQAAPDRAGGDPAPPPAPTMPPGGAVQAVSGAAGAGGAGPELPGILFAIIAASGTSALQRHRIALIVRMPSNCSTPLERPG